MIEDTTLSKACRACGVLKPLTAFHLHRHAPDGHQYDCAECVNQRGKAWYQANRERVAQNVRAYRSAHPEQTADARRRRLSKVEPTKLQAQRRRAWLKYKHGITEQTYFWFFEMQGGQCAICGVSDNTRLRQEYPLHVDHDHATGKVRGLLCHFCNAMLGQAKDRIHVLEAAIGYLKRTGSPKDTRVKGH